jgi:hypothetical protein
LSDLVAAGPKFPRHSANIPRQDSNSSATVSLEVLILSESGIKNSTAPYLYGWMFEDINHSGDGGIYGELLTNRAFDGSDVTWGTIPGFNDLSITWQEDNCLAYGRLFTYVTRDTANSSRVCVLDYVQAFPISISGVMKLDKAQTLRWRMNESSIPFSKRYADILVLNTDL